MSVEKDNNSRDSVERYIISALKYEENYAVFDEKGITKDFFTPGTNHHLFRIGMEYYKKYKKVLTPKVLAHQITHLEFTQNQSSNLVSKFKIIQSKTVNVKDVPYFCDVLKDHHAKASFRTVVSNALEVSKEKGVGNNLKAVEEARDQLNQLSDTLLEKEVNIDIVSLKDMEFIIKSELVSRKQNPEKYAGITTGIGEIDKALGAGMRAGELTLLMAPPAGGKTTTMLSLADAIYRNSKKNVLYVSLEMENSRIAMKHLSNNAIFPTTKLEMAEINSKAKEDIDAAFDERKKLIEEGIEFDYAYIAGSGRVQTSYLDDAVKRVLADHKIDILFVDYLECLRHSGSKDHWIEMGDICKFLRGMGGRYGFTTMSAVQMKRDAISRMRKTKDSELDFGADDAQGSNQISADCDRIYALILDKKDTRRMHFISAKDRYGENSYKCSLYFDGACSRVYGDETRYDHTELTDGDGLDHILQMSNSAPSMMSNDDDDVDDSILDYSDEVDYDEDDDEDIDFE